ncbi:MAG: hypothetical protein M3Y33_12925 [Actinomycetota bacterium]|nr:hypothetical protein [Actinomycetota bacterium]
MSYLPPAGVVNWTRRWVLTGVIGAVVLALVILGGWQAGWWFAGQNASRQTELIQNGDSNQRALIADMTSQVANVETATAQIDAASGQQKADLEAQRLGFAAIACQDAEQVNGPLRDGLGGWVSTNCTAGTVSPSSPLEGH